MITFIQQLLAIGPEMGTEMAKGESGSLPTLGAAAVMVAVVIWRRGHRD